MSITGNGRPGSSPGAFSSWDSVEVRRRMEDQEMCGSLYCSTWKYAHESGLRGILLTEIKEAARKVIAQMSYKGNQVDRIYSLDSFRKEVAQAISNKDGLTDDDLNVLLRYLARDKKEIVYDHEVSILRTQRDGADMCILGRETQGSRGGIINDIEPR